jgi:riboflavin synthase
MFTGLIEEIGVVERVEEEQNGRRLLIHAERMMQDLKVDDSISINGVCLTAVLVNKERFAVDVIAETRRKTTIGEWRMGTRVNLERALRADSRLGGHFVQGHVDAVALITDVESHQNEWLLTLEVPQHLKKYVIQHGAITLDGVSLTVARWQTPLATVALIPHTLEKTTLRERRSGDKINLEVDILGKYVESILSSSEPGLDEHKLKSMGYVSRLLK